MVRPREQWVLVMRRLPKVPTTLPFGPRAPPTPWAVTIQAIDHQLQDTVVTFLRDAIVCHPSLQAEPRREAFQGPSYTYDKWVGTAEQELLTIKGTSVTLLWEQTCLPAAGTSHHALPVALGQPAVRSSPGLICTQGPSSCRRPKPPQFPGCIFQGHRLDSRLSRVRSLAQSVIDLHGRHSPVPLMQHSACTVTRSSRLLLGWPSRPLLWVSSEVERRIKPRHPLDKNPARSGRRGPPRRRVEQVVRSKRRSAPAPQLVAQAVAGQASRMDHHFHSGAPCAPSRLHCLNQHRGELLQRGHVGHLQVYACCFTQQTCWSTCRAPRGAQQANRGFQDHRAVPRPLSCTSPVAPYLCSEVAERSRRPPSLCGLTWQDCDGHGLAPGRQGQGTLPATTGAASRFFRTIDSATRWPLTHSSGSRASALHYPVSLLRLSLHSYRWFRRIQVGDTVSDPMFPCSVAGYAFATTELRALLSTSLSYTSFLSLACIERCLSTT